MIYVIVCSTVLLTVFVCEIMRRYQEEDQVDRKPFKRLDNVEKQVREKRGVA